MLEKLKELSQAVLLPAAILYFLGFVVISLTHPLIAGLSQWGSKRIEGGSWAF